MPVVPGRIVKFHEAPKPQVGTALPRYVVEDGCLVLEDLKTRDLPRPPPPGWGSAKRFGLVSVAALVTFAGVLGLTVTATVLHSDDDDDARRPRDPVLVRNDTNETLLSMDVDMSTDIEENRPVEVASVESTVMPPKITVTTEQFWGTKSPGNRCHTLTNSEAIF